MNDFSHAYVLGSLAGAGGFYVGLTEDLAVRLAKHNAGEVSHTAKSRPWRIKTAIAFRERNKAAAFEKYLKTPSGAGVRQETAVNFPRRKNAAIRARNLQMAGWHLSS